MRQRTVLLVYVLAACAVIHGQSAAPREWPVSASVRQFVPQGTYNWRAATTRALITTIWYPAARGTSMSEHYIGPPQSPLFRLGVWADEAKPADGRFPLILLSHGTGGSSQIMAWLGRGLASRGYVVAAVNHPGNNALEEYTADGFLLWWERAKDLTTVLDSLVRDSALGPAVDQRRIGAIGYSLGGYTVFEIAGARTDPTLFKEFCRSAEAQGCANPPEFPNLLSRWAELEATSTAFRDSAGDAGRSYRDERIRAVFAIAPALGQALIPDSVRRITIPIEVVAGQDDRIVPIAPNAQTLVNTNRAATLTILPGVGHYTFLAVCTENGRRAQAELCTDAPRVDREAVHLRTLDLAVAFFERHLK